MRPEDFQRDFTDLVSERVGGKALACSDQWFAECTNLVKHEEPIFKKGHFIATGQWMDGWESRRSFGRRARAKSDLDHDWCVLRLGIAGELHGIDIETTHFTGNAPLFAAVEGAWAIGALDEDAEWFELLPKSPTEADSHNVFAIHEQRPCTHIRLKIYPDGGVARLRTWGRPLPRREHYVPGEILDLASVVLGGHVQQCSDMFYSSPNNLLMPYVGTNMGDGWETKRRRDEDNDWCIVRLGLKGTIRKVLIDTAHYLGNYPDHFSLEAASINEHYTDSNTEWVKVIDKTPLQADLIHLFIDEILVRPQQHFTHVRLNIFPDGGISRLRIIGEPDWTDAS
ncbi:hypothetical protein A3709_04815 [Halioglobus sp. HI00S01]|uniref:allantoicase n=1 Tax=Halioglobus sp. HI00S01 TaxID=1822214 RepID=UPI0007C33768|nr:allantoicase [Halioglobus sp. HI00S01]KZX57088.1 hypothetical protein A3709_04815 [Halioglobus sp. HI00S01]